MRAAILLHEPKYPHNVAAAIRSCAAYGVEDLVYTGERMDQALSGWTRLPREERMKGYKSVKWRRSDCKPISAFRGLVPVAIEVREHSEMLPAFQHPPNALYVFGPEDGSLPPGLLTQCHRFVAIPTRHCLNLAMAVATVLYDRQAKLEPTRMMDMAETEGRGWV